MKSLESETTIATSKELLDNAIDGIKNKLVLLRVAEFQEENDLGKEIAAQADIILNTIKNLLIISGKL